MDLERHSYFTFFHWYLTQYKWKIHFQFIELLPLLFCHSSNHLTQHCWGHAYALHMVCKVLRVVSFPQCTAGPNIVGSCCICSTPLPTWMQLSRANNVGSCSMRPFARSLILMNEGVPLVPLSMLTVVTKASFQDGRCQMQRIVGARIDSNIISSASAI